MTGPPAATPAQQPHTDQHAQARRRAGGGFAIGLANAPPSIVLAAVSDSSPAVAEPGVGGATVGKTPNT